MEYPYLVKIWPQAILNDYTQNTINDNIGEENSNQLLLISING